VCLRHPLLGEILVIMMVMVMVTVTVMVTMMCNSVTM